MSIDAEGSSTLTLVYGADESVTDRITVDAAHLREDDEPTEDGEALLTSFQLVRPDFLEDVRSSLSDDRDDEISAHARAALIDLELMTRGPEYKIASVSSGAVAGSSTLSYGCWNGVCACSGDRDCNNMFTYACGGKPYSVCYQYGSILRCYCSVRSPR